MTPTGPGPVEESDAERLQREDEELVRLAEQAGDTPREAIYRALAHARKH